MNPESVTIENKNLQMAVVTPPEFEDWGLIEYEQALARQLETLEEVSLRSRNDPGYFGKIIFCTHPPVVTKGRVTQEDDIFSWQGKIVEIQRGGRATYHGPSQVVVYPIVNISKARKSRTVNEIHGFLRDFEKAIIDTLSDFGIEAEGKSLHKKMNAEFGTEETGVWVGPQKVASLGLGIKKWITYHGAAVNLDFDANAFTGINPCGFRTSTMISIEQVLGKSLDRKLFCDQLQKNLSYYL